jgi:hypothetical protein
MVASAGILGVEPDHPLCNRFISEMIDCQSEIVAFLRSLAPLRIKAQQLAVFLQEAHANGSLAHLGEAASALQSFVADLDKGLDVYANCPQLAPEHVDKGETDKTSPLRVILL